MDSQGTVADVEKASSKAADVAPTDFYLALDGVFGDLTGSNRGGWLKLTDMVFQTESSRSIGDGGGDAGQGVPGSVQHAIFRVTLDTDRGLAQMMEALASGTPLAAAQIEGTAATLKAGNPFEATVLAYTMNEVYVTAITENADRGYSVTFEVARYTAQSFELNGTIIETGSLDVETGDAGDVVFPAVNLAGLAGNETLAGGSGADVLNGLGGNDILLGNGGADSLIGDLGNDSLDGGADADTLNGGTNNDTMRGGTGADMLTGAAGIDRFVFDNKDSGVGTARDVITDFTRGQDKIDLIALSPGVLAFVTGAFTGLGQVRVASLDATTSVVQVNLTGDTTPDYEIRLDNNAASALFTSADFAL